MTNKSNDDQLVLLKRAFAYEKAKDSVDVDEAWKEFETKLADTDSKQGMRLGIFPKKRIIR